MSAMLADMADLYNAALEQRIWAYRSRRVSISYYDQQSDLPEIRREDPAGIGRWSSTAVQQTLRRLDKAYKSFFNKKRGYPRFRQKSRFRTVTFNYGNGLSVGKDRKIGVKGVPGRIPVRWSREPPSDGVLKTAILTRQQDKWYVVLNVAAEFRSESGSGSLGVDLGITNLVATSDGTLYNNEKFGSRSQRRIRRLQRALARCKRGSRRRQRAKQRLSAAYGRLARKRRDRSHKISCGLVRDNKLIAFEDLSIRKMVHGVFARSIHDAAWSQLIASTRYKAESAGADVVLVDPRYTSQTCPDCGAVARKGLRQRRHLCTCGADYDRDVAAAKVVLARALESRRGLSPSDANFVSRRCCPSSPDGHVNTLTKKIESQSR